MSDDIDLTGYFERTGFSGSIAPTLETLATLVGLHAAAIPFENLSPLLGEPVRLERLNLQQKLVFDRRGGFCLEQNLLFHWVLETLGYENVDVLSARVIAGADDPADPQTHILLLVPFGANTYIADVGFGGNSPTAPIRLRADTEQETPHGLYRVTGGDPEWRLEIMVGEEWRGLYVFDTTPRNADDLQAINDRVSGGGRFTENVFAARAVKGKRLHLSNLTLRTHTIGGGTETATLKTVAEIRDALGGTFGIALPPAEKLDPVLATLVERELPLLGAE
jgi:N-hydroxyarylamine O-acetyltransferase